MMTAIDDVIANSANDSDVMNVSTVNDVILPHSAECGEQSAGISFVIMDT
jgi:hypothetical protein